MEAYLIHTDGQVKKLDQRWTVSMSVGGLFNDVAKMLGVAQGLTTGERVMLQPVELPWGVLWVDEEGIPKNLPKNGQVRSYYGHEFYGPAYARVRKGFTLADVLADPAPTGSAPTKHTITDAVRDNKTTPIVEAYRSALASHMDDSEDVDPFRQTRLSEFIPYARLYVRTMADKDLAKYIQEMDEATERSLMIAAVMAGAKKG